MNDDWILGFIEAKGNFSIPIQNYQVPRPKFSITLPKKFTKVLSKIALYLLERGIEPYKLREYGNSVTLEVKGLERCLKLFDFLKSLNWQSLKYGTLLRWGGVLNKIKNKNYERSLKSLLWAECKEINSPFKEKEEESDRA